MCAFKGCNRPVHTKKSGLCLPHYTQQRRGKELVPVHDYHKDEHGRTCVTCGVYKTYDNFYTYTSGHYMASCKPCRIEKVSTNRKDRIAKASV